MSSLTNNAIADLSSDFDGQCNVDNGTEGWIAIRPIQDLSSGNKKDLINIVSLSIEFEKVKIINN
jgi:hypothetical protein